MDESLIVISIITPTRVNAMSFNDIPQMSLAIADTLYATHCTKADTYLPRYLPRVEAFFQKQVQGGGLHHQFSRLKLLELAFLLERHEPRTILELGGGSTSSVFAEYVAKAPFAVRYISVDESEHYQNLTKEQLDDALRDGVDFRRCDRVVIHRDGKQSCHYETAYFEWFKEGLDFLYVDGPSNTCEDKSVMPCIDNILLLKQGITPKVIAYDMRRESLWALEKEPEFLWYDTTWWYRSLQGPDLSWFVDKPIHHSTQLLRAKNVRLGP